MTVRAPEGQYAGRFEVREGDVEPMTGSNRAEVQSCLEYAEGATPYFRGLSYIESWDFAHWGIPWQIHDDSSESPPLCLQIKGTEADPRLWLGPGDASAEYGEFPIPMREWFEWVVHPVFGIEGSVEFWLNGVQQTLLNGKLLFEEIDTLGNPLAYDKLGIYRSSESKGTAVVYHDGYRVSEEFFSAPPPPPVVITGVASGVAVRKANLNGTVNPNLFPTTYYFEYGETEAYGTKVPATEDGEAGEGSEPVTVDEAIKGLKPGTTYHFRLVADNAGGEDAGEDAEFTTAAEVGAGFYIFVDDEWKAL